MKNYGLPHRFQASFFSSLSLSTQMFLCRVCLPCNFNSYRNDYQSNSNQVKPAMLSFIGLKVYHTLTNPQKFKQTLQEIRHYVSLKNNVELYQTEYVMSIGKGEYCVDIPKNVFYLHNSYYNIPILNESDMEVLDVCYQSLMIIREYFPSMVGIELVVENDSKELMAFEERKIDEFNRRVNANLKSMLESKLQLTNQDVEDVLYLTVHHYTRKNKALALKLLISRINLDNLGQFSSQYIDILNKLQQEAQLKKLSLELTTKIKTLQREQSLNKENNLRSSNIHQQEVETPMKMGALIFQLKESFNLERICSLLESVLHQDNDKQFWSKLESSVVQITNRLLSDEYEGVSSYGTELSRLLKMFWEKRGKRWDEETRKEVERKVKQLNTSSGNMMHNKSKMPLSRRVFQ